MKKFLYKARALAALLTFFPWLVQAQDFGFIAFGDFGTGGSGQYQVGSSIGRYCQQAACNFGVLLGDNFYPNGVESSRDPFFQDRFERPYKSVNFTFYPILGNHDIRGSVSAQLNYRSQKWNFPARYYRFSYGDTLFLAIDTNILRKSGADKDQHLYWIEQQLIRSEAAWKVVYGHHPIFSNGEHGDGYYLKSRLLPLLKRYQVDFYLAGHDHHKELLERDGISFIISGAAAKLRESQAGPYTQFVRSSLGFVHIEQTGNKMTINFVNRRAQIEYSKSYRK